jgi:hypothetical protein
MWSWRDRQGCNRLGKGMATKLNELWHIHFELTGNAMVFHLCYGWKNEVDLTLPICYN